VHHRPAGPPLSARLRGAGTRWLLLSRRALRRRGGRLGLALLVSAVVAAVVLSVPVVSESSGRAPSVGLDASASSSARESDGGTPVVMGRDGEPTTPSGSAGPETTAVDPAVSAAAGRTSGGGRTSSNSAPVASDIPSSGAASPATTVPPSSAAQSPTPSAVPTPDDGETVLDLVNAARAEEGCDALVPDPALTDLAQAHSADMRDAGVLTLLTSAGGSLLELGGRAATLAHGSDDPAAVVQDWLSDPEARAALLDCSLGTAGIGITAGTDDVWWVQLLA
jgi:uncharacterized protein YkwD